MKTFFYLVLFCSLSLFAQEFKTIRVVEDLSAAGKYPAKRIYHVLKEDSITKHGEYKEFLKNKIVVSGAYKEGKKDGEWFYKGIKGLYEQKGTFKNGDRVGIWTYRKPKECYGRSYYSNEGCLDSSFAYNNEDRLLYSYKYDSTTKQGLRVTNHKDGSVRRTVINDSIKTRFNYYPNGQLYTKRTYIGDRLWEISDYYLQDGTVFKESEFFEGKGVSYEYDFKKIKKEKVKLSKEVTYANGEMNGAYISYNDKGEVFSKGMMKDNDRVGVWDVYSYQTKKLVKKNYDKKDKKETNIFEVKESYDIPFGVIESPAKLFELEKKDLKGLSKKKFSQAVNSVISKNFNTSAVADYVTAPDGICKIRMFFKINHYGELEIEKIDAPHPFIKKECERVLQFLPTFIPASQNGKLVNLMFAIPIIFRVE